MADATTVTLYSCPTGGWVMGNRYAMEKSIKEHMPNSQVEHKLGCLLTSTVVIDGKAKSEFLPLAMILPFNACFNYKRADSTGKLAKSLAAGEDLPGIDAVPATDATLLR